MLLAVVNSNKKVIMIDIDINGCISDGGVLFYSKFGELFEQGALNLPDQSTLPNSSENYPFVFISDEAFPLKVNLMKPYPQLSCNGKRQNFNQKLSRARCSAKNAFGILSHRFGVLQKIILLSPKKASIITRACCYLHNFLMRENNNNYLLFGSGENLDKCTLSPLGRTSIRNTPTNNKAIRDKFCNYYFNKGKM